MFLSLTGTLANLLPFDLSVMSMLHSLPSVLLEASVMAGSAALAAENRKHNSNDRKCEELGWSTCGRNLWVLGCCSSGGFF